MLCPKCGFSQPDEIYCVLCGVNIERYVRKRKRKQYKACIFIALIGVAAFSIAKYINSIHHAGSPETLSKDDYNENKPQVKDNNLTGAKSYRLVTGGELNSQRKTDARLRDKPPKEPPRPDRPEDKRLSGEESSRKSLLDQQKAEHRHEVEGVTGTAGQWFEKGRALDDDSEAEIQCYQKAIELDPEFALPYYLLGSIYYRQANYELADQEFAGFLKYASEADREAYDIYLYYSLADVERLFEEKVKGQFPAEETEKETPSQAEKETGEATGEETGQETSEEVMTIVSFSPIDGHITVPVLLNGFLDARVLVDTGAGITILSRELARNLRLEGEAGSSITLKTIAMDIQAQLARLDSIQVGNLSRNNFPVAITDLPLGEKRKFDGILGIDFLNNYKIHIDNENNRIVLTPRAGQNAD